MGNGKAFCSLGNSNTLESLGILNNYILVKYIFVLVKFVEKIVEKSEICQSEKVGTMEEAPSTHGSK